MKLLFTCLAHAQTNIASRTSTNITCHTNIHKETSLHLFGSRTNKHCLANLNQHHMPHEHSLSNFSSPLWLTHKQTLPREPQPTSHATRTFLYQHFSSPLWLTHKQTLPREPQPTSHATRTFLITLLFTSLAHAQTNIASRTSTNITCHTNIPQNTSLHLFGSRTNKHCLANLNQHHMPHEHSLSNFSSPLWLTHKQTLPREPQPTSHATRTFLYQHFSSPLWLTPKQTLPCEPQPTSHATRMFVTRVSETLCVYHEVRSAVREQSMRFV